MHDGHARSGAEANHVFCPARKYNSPEAGVFPPKRAGQIYFRAGQQSGRNVQVSVTMSMSRYNHFDQFIIVIYLVSIDTPPA
jgi:hypothetical protein